jgi:hypothetical protein
MRSRDPIVGSAAPRGLGERWPAFTRLALASGLALLGALYGFVLALDPYGTRAAPGRPVAPIMDLNQRYMYPQLARSGAFDAAVFGTSTIRLLDPERLDAAFGARFANFGLNAGTPWEQWQLASLFLRHVPAPSMLVFGLDTTWCDENDPQLTVRSFPPWLYDEDRLNDLAHPVSLKSLEIAGRVLLNRLGLMPDRIRRDGFEVFTPREDRYDAARARVHIWSGRLDNAPLRPAVELSQADRRHLTWPALARLDGLLARVPPSTRTVLLLPPIHVAAQARPGSREEAIDRACKEQIAGIARKHSATLLDYRRPSPLTKDDSNYWDSLHYRLPVATRLIGDLRGALAGGAGNDIYTAWSPGGRR